MKIQTLGLFAAVGALAVASAGSLMSCSQPPIECTAGHGDFAVRYVPVSGDPGCNVKPPEHVGFQVYNPVTNQDNCEQRMDDLVCDDTEADASKIRIAMQAEQVGNAFFTGTDSDEAHKAFSVGDVKEVLPDADGFCYLPAMTPAQQNAVFIEQGMGGMGPGGSGCDPDADPPDVDLCCRAYNLLADVPTVDAPKDVTLAWSNVKLFVTAAVPGTQFEADLTYTNNGCTAQFKAIGMYPAIDCGVYGDHDMDPCTPDVLIDTDPTLCDPNPAPEKGRFFGSGINPDFPTKCEQTGDYDGLDIDRDGVPDGIPDGIPDGALCVLDRDAVPALK